MFYPAREFLLTSGNSIEGLTEIEAAWFGKLLQARPALLDRVPSTVLDMISDSLTDVVDLRERDPESFKNRPLHFFT